MDNVIESFISIIAIIFTFGIPGIIVFWYLHNKHKERMKLIEKGLTPEALKPYHAELKLNMGQRNVYSALKWGILLAFVGLGLFLTFLLSEVWDFEEIGPALVILFAGVG